MKFLNLDDINLDSERTVKFRGVTYKVKDFTLSEFVQFQEHFNNFSKYYNSQSLEDTKKVIDEVRSLVAISIPDFPQELVEEFSPIQMMMVVSMIANLIPAADEETTEAIQEKKEDQGE